MKYDKDLSAWAVERNAALRKGKASNELEATGAWSIENILAEDFWPR